MAPGSLSVEEYNRRYNKYWADRKVMAPPVYTVHVNHLMSDYIEKTLRVEELEEELKSALNEADKVRGINERCTKEIETKRTQILDLRAILQNQMDEKESVIKHLKDMTKLKERLEQKVEQLERTVETHERSLKQRANEIDILKDQVKRLQTKKGDVLDLKMQLSQRTAEREASIAKVLEMHDQMSGVMNKWKSAESQRKILENRVEKLEKEQDQPFILKCFPALKASDNLYHIEPIPSV